MTSPQRLIYFFGSGAAEGGSEVKDLVGGKGASLADMTRAGLNVPPGFIISAACCELYYRQERNWPSGLKEAVGRAMARLETLVGRPFGRGDNPLLVAVRSGAAQSMPGMMDTLLNVGLNPECVAAMARRTGNPRAAWEAYRHCLGMFGHTVGGIDEAVFTALIDDTLRDSGKPTEQDLDAAEVELLCGRFLDAYRRHTGRDMPTDPHEMLEQAIEAVFGSWTTERAVVYRKHHRIEGLFGTAVNVQMMCPSEVSGVMFTANPVNPDLDQILIESSYGLGEAIVLGKVTPDRFVVSRRDGRIVERVIAVKDRVTATLAQDGRGQTGARDAASLDDAQVTELAELGRRVEAHFKVPCDVEWGLSEGRFYLLQARPIRNLPRETTAGASASPEDAGREQVRREEIAALQALAEPGGTVWARFNLAEILPAPTPMTWAIVRRFMSGRGGFGQMYRDLGFEPDPALDEQGIFDLVCGRPYCNLSREPRMQYRLLPVEHSFRALKADPQKALYPQAVFSRARLSWRFWLYLPAFCWKAFRSELRVRQLSRTFATHLREGVLPAFAEETTRAAGEDLSSLDSPALLQRLEHWVRRTLHDFARDSLKPTVLATLARNNLERALAQVVPGGNPQDPVPRSNADKVRSLLGELSMGAHPDPEAHLSAAVRELASGKLDRATFVERFGHRGSQEMELANPRWAEEPAALDFLAAQGHAEAPHPPGAGADDAKTLLEKYGVPAAVWPALEGEVKTLHTYLGLRETAKHYLMRGYAQIRRTLVELDGRYQLAGGIFYLTPEELPRLLSVPASRGREPPEGNAVAPPGAHAPGSPPSADKDLLELIAGRRRRRRLALELPVPQVLFSDDLEAIGRPLEVGGADALQGVPLSAGVVEGPALVLQEPRQTGLPSEPYILVCPSTDPAWVPLFVNARGLVMETGGVLSHGAIVAREFGLPAVAGLPDVHRRVRTGQRLRIDGATGKVNLLA